MSHIMGQSGSMVNMPGISQNLNTGSTAYIRKSEEKPIVDHVEFGTTSQNYQPEKSMSEALREIKSVSCSSPENSLSGIIDGEKHINSLDITTSMFLCPAMNVLTPDKPDQPFSEMVTEAPGDFRYRQAESKPIDVEGDAHLIRDLDRVPGEIVKSVFGRNVKKEEPAGEVKSDVIVGKQKPINMDALINKFRQIIQENPQITPTLGKEHQWSPQAKKFLKFGFIRRLFGFLGGKNSFPVPLMGRSKLFLCLACGWTSRYMKTGTEDDLKSKLIGYKDKSINIHDVLKESYILNKGNLYETLLTAENVMGGEIYKKDRSQAPLQKKLKYIRNDSKPEGDNYGAWYHLMGAGLYSMMRPGWVAKSVVEIESFGSLFMEGKDPQEDHINRLGAEMGNKLKQMMNDGSWKKPVTPETDTRYMTLTEFKGK